MLEDATGWNVELLLPWTIATMRGSDTATRTVAVQVDRVVASRSERSATPPVFYGNSVYLSGFERITIPQYRAQIFDVFPYVSALYDIKNPGSEFRAGADLFWKPSGDFQLTATVNPDFGQVESDELVEITPTKIRLRKKVLTEEGRRRAGRSGGKTVGV